jgi:hypothetical protein
MYLYDAFESITHRLVWTSFVVISISITIADDEIVELPSGDAEDEVHQSAEEVHRESVPADKFRTVL